MILSYRYYNFTDFYLFTYKAFDRIAWNISIENIVDLIELIRLTVILNKLRSNFVSVIDWFEVYAAFNIFFSIAAAGNLTRFLGF